MSEYIVDLTDVEKRKFSWSMETLYEQVPVYEEIVRCRDCQYFDVDGEAHQTLANRRYCERLWAFMEPGGFCSESVRRDDR